MTPKRWKHKPLPNKDKVDSLSKEININSYLATILVQRGIETFDQAKAYFRPTLNELHDPFLMKDMDKAVQRLTQAIETKEKILVYGDYDVDGTTSVSLVYDFLSHMHPFLAFYIPDRHVEGYGVSYKGIDFAHENGFGLMIALDCGIKSVDHVRYAKEKGVDFIICDHHKPGETLPEAAACLDPKRSDCAYPYKELSGCGVGFKLLQAFCIRHSIPLDRLYPYLDLVAISIASDIVPITGENRVMTFFGLQRINERHRPGIKALVETAGFKKDLTVTNVVFGLGPRINAAGRIKHAKASVELLISQSEQVAKEFALELNQKNTTRKDLDAGTLREALALIEKNEVLLASKSTVLFKNDWHKGVIGIVASKCIEKYYRPTIILTESNNKATGSARSVDGFDLYEAIYACADLLEQFGGHTHAAGLTLKIENIPAFVQRFEEVVAQRITEEQQVPEIQIDVEIPLDIINEKFYSILAQMEPFGPQNLHPVFLTRGVVPTNVRLMKEEHVKFSVKQNNGTLLDVVGFNMGHCYETVMEGKPVNICYTIDVNEYNGNRSLQLMLKDVKCE